MSQETNSTVYLLAQKQRRGRRAALVTGCQVNDRLHQWILWEVSVCTDWASLRKGNRKRGGGFVKNPKNRETQTGGTEKKTKTHQTRMPLILSWAKRRRQSLSVTQKKKQKKTPAFMCLLPALSFFGARAWGREAFQVKAQPAHPPPCVCFCNLCKCS